MDVILDLFFIQVIVVFIVDISGVADTFKSLVKYIVTKGKMKDSNYDLKPWTCSLCMTWWTGIIYLLWTGNFTLPYIVVLCLLCAFCDVVGKYIILIEDIAIKITQLIYKIIDKI